MRRKTTRKKEEEAAGDEEKKGTKEDMNNLGKLIGPVIAGKLADADPIVYPWLLLCCVQVAVGFARWIPRLFTGGLVMFWNYGWSS